jgi:uncharacterized protein
VSSSAVYEGTVRHRRFAVRSHEFRQRLALAYIDLDELPGLLGGRLLASGLGLVRFRRGDYLGEAHRSLSDAVRDTAEAQTGVRPLGPIRLLTFAKELHVSPFMGMSHRYEWHMTAPAQTLSVHISSRQEERVAFDATLALRRRELTRASLAKCSASTLCTLASIYKQAALLKLKGVPVHAHAGVDPA